MQLKFLKTPFFVSCIIKLFVKVTLVFPQKSNKLVIIGGVTYKSSANKLSKTQKSQGTCFSGYAVIMF